VTVIVGVTVSACWVELGDEVEVAAEMGVEAVVAAAWSPFVLAPAVATDGDVVSAVRDCQSVQAIVCGSCCKSALLGCTPPETALATISTSAHVV